MSILQFKEAIEKMNKMVSKTSSPPFLLYHHKSHIRCQTQDLETVRSLNRVLQRIPIKAAKTQLPIKHPTRSNLVLGIRAA